MTNTISGSIGEPLDLPLRYPEPASGLRVAVLEERRNCSGRSRDDDHGPEFEEHVDHPSPRGERVLDLRRHRQQLDGREEEGLAECPHIAAVGVSLEEVEGDCAAYVYRHGGDNDQDEPRPEATVSLSEGEEPREFVSDCRHELALSHRVFVRIL